MRKILVLSRLALGWYSIMAPNDRSGTMDATRPIKEWVIFSGFDKSEDCEKRRREMISDSIKKYGRYNPKTKKTDFEGDEASRFESMLKYIVCVPTDKMF